MAAYPKVLPVENHFRIPRGVEIQNLRERSFNAHTYTATQLNRNVYPYECINGWYVIDAVRINKNQVIVSFGLVSNQI